MFFCISQEMQFSKILNFRIFDAQGFGGSATNKQNIEKSAEAGFPIFEGVYIHSQCLLVVKEGSTLLLGHMGQSPIPFLRLKREQGGAGGTPLAGVCGFLKNPHRGRAPNFL